MNISMRQIDEIRDLLGGWPVTVSQYEREAARFGCQVEWRTQPFRDRDSFVADGIIHVPQLHPGDRPRRCHIHELVEAALISDQADGIRRPAGVSNHDIARAIDLSEPRRCRSARLDMLIQRTAISLSKELARAGVQQAILRTGKRGWTLLLDDAPGMRIQ